MCTETEVVHEEKNTDELVNVWWERGQELCHESGDRVSDVESPEEGAEDALRGKTGLDLFVFLAVSKLKKREKHS